MSYLVEVNMSFILHNTLRSDILSKFEMMVPSCNLPAFDWRLLRGCVSIQLISQILLKTLDQLDGGQEMCQSRYPICSLPTPTMHSLCMLSVSRIQVPCSWPNLAQDSTSMDFLHSSKNMPLQRGIPTGNKSLLYASAKGTLMFTKYFRQ